MVKYKKRLCIIITTMLVFTACSYNESDSSESQPLQSDTSVSMTETISESKAEAETGNYNKEEMRTADIIIPISTFNTGRWALHDTLWIDESHLIAVMVIWDETDKVVEKRIVLYSLADKSEQVLMTLDSNIYFNDIQSDEENIYLFTNAIYTINKSDYSIKIQPNYLIGLRDLGYGTRVFNVRSGLLVESEDSVIVIKRLDGSAPDISLKTEEDWFNNPLWSPDGNCFLYYSNKRDYHTSRDKVSVADKDGNTVCELYAADTNEPFEWSSNGRYIVTVLSRQGNHTIRMYDIYGGKETGIAEQLISFNKGFCILDIHDAQVAYRWTTDEGKYTASTIDIIIGEKIDLTTMDKYCFMEYSPSGQMIAVIEGKSPPNIQIFNVD